MTSLILRTAARLLTPLLLLTSVFLLLRGHHEPGGGFVGGLVAASAFVTMIFSHGVATARHSLRIDPRTLVGLGLFVAVGSGLVGMLRGAPFLTGTWAKDGPIEIGTPLVFDLGVYLVVIGVTLLIVFALAEEEAEIGGDESTPPGAGDEEES